jgi:integrase
VKSWALRYRRPNGKTAKLTLGSLDLSGKEPDYEPKLGTPLSLSAARAVATDQLHQRARGVDVAAVHVGNKRREREAAGNAASNSFASLALTFLDEHCKKQNRRWWESASLFGFDYPRDGQSDPTMRKGGLAARWRDRELRSITADELHDLIDEAQRDGVPGRKPRQKGVNDSRGRAMAAALSVFFGWAKKNRHIGLNPALDLHKPKPARARERVLNAKLDVRKADEVRWFWSACAGISEPYGALLKLLLLTGCHRDEIAKLTVEEVSDDCTTLRLSGKRVKNHRGFEVYLPPLARDLLVGVKRFVGCRLWFSTNGQTPVASWSKAKRDLDAAMLQLAREERGVDYQIEPFRLHDLRRTCATGMAGLKIGPHIIEACLNHISGHKAGVAGVYNQETYSEEKKAAWARWAAHLESIINGEAQSNVLPFAAREA